MPCFGSGFGLDLGHSARATVSMVSRISGPDDVLVTVSEALSVEDTDCAASPSSSSSSGWLAVTSLAVWLWSPRSLWSMVGPLGFLPLHLPFCLLHLLVAEHLHLHLFPVVVELFEGLQMSSALASPLVWAPGMSLWQVSSEVMTMP